MLSLKKYWNALLKEVYTHESATGMSYLLLRFLWSEEETKDQN